MSKWFLTGYIGPKAVAVPFQAERVVEAMRIFAPDVAGEREFVASGLTALLEGVSHHSAADASALMAGVDGNVLDDAGFFAALGHVVHDEQFVGSDDVRTSERDKNAKRGVLPEPGEVVTRFSQSEVVVVSNIGGQVEVENSSQIFLSCFADGEIEHCSSLR